MGKHRDIAADRQFFTQTIKQHGAPKKISLDGYPATHTAISELKTEEVLPQSTKVRTSKYLNNLIEQDHRKVKQRIYPMLGSKKFRNAAVTISGIELVQQIRKGQFDTSAVIERRDANVALMGRSALGMRSIMEKHSCVLSLLFAPEPLNYS